jgi:predicted nuclease of predicted toxin-antitoxin system
MRFKVDENLPDEVAAALRSAGHDAITVLDQGAGGSPDAVLAALLQREKRAILTLDQGFGDIRLYSPSDYAGLVVLRLRKQDKRHVLDVLPRLIAALRVESPEGMVWIVEESRVRVRGAVR